VSLTLTIGEKRTDFLDVLLVKVTSPVVSVVVTVSSVTDGKEHFKEDDNFSVAFVCCCSSGNLSIALGLGGDIESSAGSNGSVSGIGVLSEWLDKSKSRAEVEAMVLGVDRIIDMVVMMVDS